MIMRINFKRHPIKIKYGIDAGQKKSNSAPFCYLSFKAVGIITEWWIVVQKNYGLKKLRPPKIGSKKLGPNQISNN